MTIKDVEKLTGLTAKSIRYYESKGLLKVERNEENAYRNYSEDDVRKLRKIKLFRYLDFGVEEIREFLEKDISEVQTALYDKAEKFAEQKEKCDDKQELCLALAKEYGSNEKVVEKYNQTIQFLESEELEEAFEIMKDASCPTLPLTILYSIIFLGPVLSIFYNINIGQFGDMNFQIAAALVGTALTTFTWYRYISYYRRYRMRVKKNNRDRWWIFPALILMIVFGLLAFVVLTSLVRELFAPEDYLFYEHTWLGSMLLIGFIIIPTLLLIMKCVGKIKKKTSEEMEMMNDVPYIWNRIGKWKPLVTGLWIFGIYCCITNFTVVTENKIICHSPTHPSGISYSYADVEKIVTGFGTKRFAFVEYHKRGNFYYQISIDGKDIVFQTPSVNESIYEDSYLELEEFDQKLVALGIAKTSSVKGEEYCDLDQRYVDRFVRIIQNK